MGTESVVGFLEEWGLPAAAEQSLRALLHAESGSSVIRPSVVAAFQEEIATLDFMGEGSDDSSPDLVEDRYELGEVIGRGGMGEVMRVHDRDLQRTMVMKVIRPDRGTGTGVVTRFFEEAQVTAQLEHPGIVPVHELGALPDGRIYFTMKEVRGKEFGDVIREVHEASSPNGWARAGAWSLRRLVDALHKVCIAVAYGHSRGVVHRDLKPQNVMVGEFGEVLVMDWGLAKVVDSEGSTLVTLRSQGNNQTVQGTVAGTPAYMPLEQATGDLSSVGPRWDVYALGAMLHQVLCGRPPYQGRTSLAVLQEVLAGPPRSLEEHTTPPLPAELVEICERAMHREAAERFADAGELATAVVGWLDGARRQEEAERLVAAARELEVVARAAERQADALELEAAELFERLGTREAAADRARGWELQDEAASQRRQAAHQDMEAERLVHAALLTAPDLWSARSELLTRVWREHGEAEARGDSAAAMRAEGNLKAAVEGLPAGETRTSVERYLTGNGALTLHTNPPGAEAKLYRFEPHQRRLVPVLERSLGHTPLNAVELPMGSFLIELQAPGHERVRFPVQIGRREHWNQVPPGAAATQPVPLPKLGEVLEHECYVPPGWFWAGGDSEAVNALPRQRVWLDGFVIGREPVTHADYLKFLNYLLNRGNTALADRLAPQVAMGPHGIGPLYERSMFGGFSMKAAGPFGGITKADPVFLVDWEGALTFTQYAAKRAKLPLRLVGEMEFEKAARGVDARPFPWGDHYDPTWACSNRSDHRGVPVRTSRFSADESVYGVRGLAGNVRTWCADPFQWGGPVDAAGRGEPALLQTSELLEHAGVARGGYCFGDSRCGRSASREWRSAFTSDPSMGIRLARTLGG